MNKLKTIKSTDYRTVKADSVEVLVDPNPPKPLRGPKPDPVIGIKVDQTNGKQFIMPLAYDCAKEMAECILRTLLAVAPELFIRES